jgi:hypothetical protein
LVRGGVSSPAAGILEDKYTRFVRFLVTTAIHIGNGNIEEEPVMELFLQEVCKLLFGWWWFGMDGRTKTANAADRFIMPVLIVLSLCGLLVLLMWKWQ